MENLFSLVHSNPFAPIVWLAAVPIFLYLDRAWGAPDMKRKAKIGVLITALLGSLAGGLLVGIAVLLWALYRSMAFFGGSAAPINSKQVRSAVMRHLWVGPLILIATYFAGERQPLELLATVLVFLIYTAGATFLAIDYGKNLQRAERGEITQGQFDRLNEKVEKQRGALFGCAFALWALVVTHLV
jgi:hypothetical protein